MKEESVPSAISAPRATSASSSREACLPLSASGAVVSCECGESSLTIEAEENKFRLSVPCGVCGEEHLAECSADKLLHGAASALPAPIRKCSAALSARTTPSSTRWSSFRSRRPRSASRATIPPPLPISVIMYEVLSELKEIAARKDGITCSCGSKSYGMEIHSTYVDLVCKSCGAKLRIPAATDEDLDRLCCRMKLQIKSE